MRIVCPSCDAAYDVPTQVVAAGRTLRCVRCGAEFVAGERALETAPPAAVAAPPRTATPGVATLVATEPGGSVDARPAPRTGEHAVLRRRRAAVLAGWAVSAMVLGAGAWAGIAWRGAVTQAWPASGRLYAALGYAPGP